MCPIDSEYIFGGRSGREPQTSHIYRVGAWEMVKRYAKITGVEKVKPHDFRRFVGTPLVKTRGIHAAQKVFGYKRIETTAQNYTYKTLRE